MDIYYHTRVETPKDPEVAAYFREVKLLIASEDGYERVATELVAIDDVAQFCDDWARNGKQLHHFINIGRRTK